MSIPDIEYRELFETPITISENNKQQNNINDNDYTNNESEFKKLENNVIFKYLENDSLSLDIQYQRNIDLKYNLHLCVYEIDQTARLPFIKYIFNTENNDAFFPIVDLIMEPFKDFMKNNNYGGNNDEEKITESENDSDNVEEEKNTVLKVALAASIANKDSLQVESKDADNEESQEENDDDVKGEENEDDNEEENDDEKEENSNDDNEEETDDEKEENSDDGTKEENDDEKEENSNDDTKEETDDEKEENSDDDTKEEIDDEKEENSKESEQENDDDSEEFEDSTKGFIDKEFLKQIRTALDDKFDLAFKPETMYKGFLENNSNIFVFIDATNEQFTKKSNIECGIIDEILNTGHIKDSKIRPYILDLFKSNKLLQNIKTIEEVSVQFPKIGYISDINSQEYYNLFKQKDNRTSLLLPKTVKHGDTDEVYLFSAVPITIGNIENIRRYACFIENLDIQESANKNEDNFSFEENNIHFYALREYDLFVEL